jgi:hypothetical protein
VKLENSVESNPDVIEIINTLEQECQRHDIWLEKNFSADS